MAETSGGPGHARRRPPGRRAHGSRQREGRGLAGQVPHAVPRIGLGRGDRRGHRHSRPSASSLGPSFAGEDWYWVNLGPADSPTWEEGTYVPVVFTRAPDGGNLARRVAFVRRKTPQAASTTATSSRSSRTPACTSAAPSSARHDGFGCPCHGGQYDTEGRRTAGPPVRPLNRFEYKVERRGHLFIGRVFATKEQDGEVVVHRHLEAIRASRRTGLLSLPLPAAAAGRSAMSTAQSPRPRKSSSCPSTGSRSAPASSRVGKYFLFRNVPKDISWLQTLGASLLTVFIAAGRRPGRPGDVLPAGPGSRRSTPSATSPTRRRSAGSCAACTSGARR